MLNCCGCGKFGQPGSCRGIGKACCPRIPAIMFGLGLVGRTPAIIHMSQIKNGKFHTIMSVGAQASFKI